MENFQGKKDSAKEMLVCCLIRGFAKREFSVSLVNSPLYVKNPGHNLEEEEEDELFGG